MPEVLEKTAVIAKSHANHVLHGKGYVLIQGDSLTMLPTLIPESVDMIFADPPYNLSNGGFTCHAGRAVGLSKHLIFTARQEPEDSTVSQDLDLLPYFSLDVPVSRMKTREFIVERVNVIKREVLLSNLLNTP